MEVGKIFCIESWQKPSILMTSKSTFYVKIKFTFHHHLNATWIPCSFVSSKSLNNQDTNLIVYINIIYLTAVLFFRFSSVKFLLIFYWCNWCRNLNMDYIDLYLIHWPVSAKPGIIEYPIKPEDFITMDFKSVWAAMEDCQRLGLTKSIGVSNFSCKKLEEILSTANIPPAVNQVCSETSLNFMLNSVNCCIVRINFVVVF